MEVKKEMLDLYPHPVKFPHGKLQSENKLDDILTRLTYGGECL